MFMLAGRSCLRAPLASHGFGRCLENALKGCCEGLVFLVRISDRSTPCCVLGHEELGGTFRGGKEIRPNWAEFWCGAKFRKNA